ncbi:polyprenyl synthetase family protein [Streptomyces tendae]|uniref:polyprenyl synthetase family protein n=1 Tax=Streptomyces TaxID=1883 RepID=UPI003D9E78D8
MDRSPPTPPPGAVVRILGEVLDARMSEAHDVDAEFARQIAGRVSAFARRGGKRLRTAFAWCGWRAGGGSGDPVPLLRTGAALEMVQTCAQVHDDVMDGSYLRRGAPAVHVDLARMHQACLAVWSSDRLLQLPSAPRLPAR